MHYNIIMESFSNDNNSNENLVEKKLVCILLNFIVFIWNQ